MVLASRSVWINRPLWSSQGVWFVVYTGTLATDGSLTQDFVTLTLRGSLKLFSLSLDHSPQWYFIEIGPLFHSGTLEACGSLGEFVLPKLGGSLCSISTLCHAGSLGFNGTLTRDRLLTISGTLAWEWNTQTSWLWQEVAFTPSRWYSPSGWFARTLHWSTHFHWYCGRIISSACSSVSLISSNCEPL